MTSPRKPLGPIDHGVGAALSLGVFAFAAQIATAISELVSWCSERLDGDGTISFVAFELHTSTWALLGGMMCLGLLVAGFDYLVRKQRMRSWVPPLATLTGAASVIALLAGDDVGWQGRAAIGGGLGAVVGLAFAAWWFASHQVAQCRRRGQPGGERP